MRKCFFRIFNIVLVLILGLSLVGCGSSSSGDNSSGIEGYWKVQKASGTDEDTGEEWSITFPRSDLSDEVDDLDIDDDGEEEDVLVYVFLSFVDGKGQYYNKFTFDDPGDSADFQNIIVDEGTEYEYTISYTEGVFYGTEMTYTIDGNKLNYTATYDGEEKTGIMEFAITGNTATIIDKPTGGTAVTIVAIKVDASAVEGAQQSDKKGLNIIKKP